MNKDIVKSCSVVLNETHVYYIYGLINLCDNNVFYIGSSKNPEQRFKQHIRQSRQSQVPVYAFIREIDFENVDFEIFDSTTKDRFIYEGFWQNVFKDSILNLHFHQYTLVHRYIQFIIPDHDIKHYQLIKERLFSRYKKLTVAYTSSPIKKTVKESDYLDILISFTNMKIEKNDDLSTSSKEFNKTKTLYMRQSFVHRVKLDLVTSKYF